MERAAETRARRRASEPWPIGDGVRSFLHRGAFTRVLGSNASEAGADAGRAASAYRAPRLFTCVSIRSSVMAHDARFDGGTIAERLAQTGRAMRTSLPDQREACPSGRPFSSTLGCHGVPNRTRTKRSSPHHPAVFHASTMSDAQANRIGLVLTVPASR